MATTRTRYANHGDLDPLLKPVVATRADSDIYALSLAVAKAAITNDASVHQARIWLLRNEPRTANVTAHAASWSPVVTKARRHLADRSSAAAQRREKLKVARALVAHTLTPNSADLGINAHASTNARHVLAVTALKSLDSINAGDGTVVRITGEWLGSVLGCNGRTANTAIHACLKAGWLTGKASKGGGWRVRLVEVRGGTKSEVAWAHASTVDAVSEQRLDRDPVADILLTAQHPVWAFEADTKTWLVALAMDADVDPRTLGVASRVPALRRQWLDIVASAPDAEIETLLDAHAAKTGADDRAHAARVAYVQAAKARGAERKAADFLKRTTRTLVSITPESAPDARQAWVTAMQTAVQQGHLPAEQVAPLGVLVAKHLTRRGFSETVAAKVADHVVGAPSPVAA